MCCIAAHGMGFICGQWYATNETSFMYVRNAANLKKVAWVQKQISMWFVSLKMYSVQTIDDDWSQEIAFLGALVDWGVIICDLTKHSEYRNFSQLSPILAIFPNYPQHSQFFSVIPKLSTKIRFLFGIHALAWHICKTF